MRATWTDSRLDDFAANVDRRFDAVDQRLDKLDVDLRDVRSEIAANSRSMLQFCGVTVAAQMATVATLIAIHA